MKKFLITAIILLGAFCSVQAQAVTKTFTDTIGSRVDSITCISNTANYIYASPTTGIFHSAVIQLKVDRVSAAAGGIAFLQGSIDGTNYYTATYAAGDTVTIANSASQYLKINIPPAAAFAWKHLRLKCTGASSDTIRVRAVICGRP